MESRARWDLVGALVGAALGVSDFLLLTSLGANMVIRGRDAAGMLLAFLVSAFALLGYAAGRLARARARAGADAETIKRQLQELERAQRAVIQQEKLAGLGRLAAGIAHEIRNPLGVIRASASLVRERSFQPGQDAYRACQFICQETDRLNGLIHSLLSLSRPAPLRAESMELATVIERGLHLAQDALGQRHVEARRAISPDTARVWGDPDLLTQALFGLLVNAAESLEGGGVVQIRLESDDGAIYLEVADDGPGIPPQHVEKIFEPFFTTKPRGSGLGLPMASRIVEAHGGKLEIAPGRGAGAGGRGACFRLTLPIHREVAEVPA